MKRLSTLISILLPFLLLSCTQEAPTAYVDDASSEYSPSVLSKNHGPPEFSGIVVRGETDIGLVWGDQKTGLMVAIGFDPLEYCSGIENFDLISYTDKWLPNGRPLVTVEKGDDLRTSIWPFLDFDCELFASMDPLAVGTSDLVATDNDFFGASPDDSNANAWGFRAHGPVMLGDGLMMDFSGHANYRYSNKAGFKVNTKVVLE